MQGEKRAGLIRSLFPFLRQGPKGFAWYLPFVLFCTGEL